MQDQFLLANFHQRRWVITLQDLTMFYRHLVQQNFHLALSVNDFLKRYSLIKISKSGIERLGPSVIKLAAHENLDGHANSIKIRLKRDN